MTPQEIFDFVAGKLAAQKAAAFKPNRPGSDFGSCVYLTEDGCMCAIGHILPTLGLPEETLQRMQRYVGDVSRLVKIYAEGAGIELPTWFVSNADYLLTDLQNVHDVKNNWADNKKNMGQHLQRVAVDYGLIFDLEAWLKSAGVSKPGT